MNAEQLLAQKKQLLRYYEDELSFLRTRALEFADRYRGRADALGLREGQAADPHVERLLEGVALLAGRIRAKLDDEFPELTDSLLGVLYPHLLAPVPSMAVVQIQPPPGSVDLVEGLVIPKHTEVVSEPIDGVACRYRTGYSTTLWPVEIQGAAIRSRPFPANIGDLAPAGTKFLFTLKLKASGIPNLAASALGKPRRDADTPLRVFLAGDASATAVFHEHLFNDVVRVVVRNPTAPPGSEPAVMDFDRSTRVHEWIRPVGFHPDEALLPYPPQAFPGYRVLTEFFAYREKFLFADLLGWARARALGVLDGGTVEVHFFLDKDVSPNLEKAFAEETIAVRLGCTPVVNLFEKLAEVIPLTHRTHEYPIVPDRHQPDGYEVYSVEEVMHRNATTGHEVKYEPFYSFRHRGQEAGRAYWCARRRPSTRMLSRGGERFPDRGTEVDLCFVDLGFSPMTPAEDQVLVKVMCVNRDLPTPAGEGARSEVRFETRGQYGTMQSVKAPTPTLRPPPRTGAYWRLLSHLSLNHLSIADPEEGRDALREYLRLYDYADPRVYPKLASVNRQVVDGLERVSCGPDVELIQFGAGTAYARGLQIQLSLDEEKFEGVGAFLFATVLDRFFAMYASINSFTRVKYHTRKSGNDAVKIWPPRVGTRPLL
jgi:type VI secretion system protein ImpG